jgi:signal transduction histidine kinase
MKPESARFAQRYAAALSQHLKPGSRALARSALWMGRDALAQGLGTLELARIHEQALTVMEPFRRKPGKHRRAEDFFARACATIMEAHHRTAAKKITLNRLRDMTNRRAAELKSANRELQRGIARRKVQVHAFQKTGAQQNACLGKALELQKRLQRGSHRALAAQEDERRKISHELQDEIAQMLLGIHVRLLSLRQKARSRFQGLKNEIASTRRLVVKSARSVRRFARNLDNRPEEQGIRLDTVS